MENKCPFCNRNNKEILLKTNNFIVTPSLGSLTPGHLMICTRKHFIGLSEMPEEFFSELEFVKNKIKKILSDKYRPPLIFEHGAIEDKFRGGCCIDHAHLHLVPVEEEILKDLCADYKPKEIRSIYEIKKQFLKKRHYIYYENQKAEKYIFEISGIPESQYVRKIISSKINKKDHWNWRRFPKFEVYYKTLRDLKPYFI